MEAAHNGFSESIVRHNGILMTLRNLQGPGFQFYWVNLTIDVKNHAESCLECLHEQPTKQVKVYKPIIPKAPFERFTADLYQIPDAMVQASGTKHRYILSCVDHFSKYKWTELIPNKEAQTIVQKLYMIFNCFKSPTYFQTDNGKEFQNSKIQDLCNRKNIKHVHRRPYHPPSQGVVEKLNDLIARSLTSSLAAFRKKKDKGSTLWRLKTL